MDWINWPITIKLTPNAVELDGVRMSYMQVAEILNQIIHPDPRKWYRLERIGDIISINVKMTEDEPNGTTVGTTGHSSNAARQEDPGRTGTETPHP